MTPNIPLETVPSNSLQPSVPINDSLQTLDALVRPGGIVEAFEATPPTTTDADAGRTWVVDAGASGSFAGHVDEIALCTAANLWRFYQPKADWLVFNRADGQEYSYAGSGGWLPVGGGGGAVSSVNGDTGDVIVPVPIGVACSDETTALTTGAAKVTFRMPFAMTVTGVRANLKTAQASGSIFTVDINEGGASILSTKITIDNTEKTSTTAATPPVISDSALADDAEITVDIDQVGDGTAIGLKVWLIGYPA